MVLVGVAAVPQIPALVDVAPEVAAVHEAFGRLPVARARQRSGVAAPPVIASPPTVRVVRVGSVAVPVVISFVCVGLVAVCKVVVREIGITPAALRHDAAEPALAAAVERPVEERGLWFAQISTAWIRVLPRRRRVCAVTIRAASAPNRSVDTIHV